MKERESEFYSIFRGILAYAPILFRKTVYTAKLGEDEMIQVVIVLNKEECLDELIESFMANGISGGTILNSCGMARSLRNKDDNPLFAMIRDFIDADGNGSKVIFMIAEESQIRTISQIVNKVTGGLQNPNTGIMFCTPVLYIEGLHKNKEKEE